jgi:hypothetical protein
VWERGGGGGCPPWSLPDYPKNRGVFFFGGNIFFLVIKNLGDFL